MRQYFSFWRLCARTAAAGGNSSFANDWQWIFGNPVVTAFGSLVIAGLGGLFPTIAKRLGVTDMSTTGSPAFDSFIGALAAFAVTWLVIFSVRLAKAPSALYYAEKKRADEASGKAVSILERHRRNYSAKHKDDISAILDSVVGAINDSGNKICHIANGLLQSNPYDRSEHFITASVKALDILRDLTVSLNKLLFEELYKTNPEYPIELNLLVWPQQPLLDFQLAAAQFRNCMFIWGTTSGWPKESDVQEMQLLIGWSRMSFDASRTKFVSWLDGRNERVTLTRRDLLK
jgi:hypothetical protein